MFKACWWHLFLIHQGVSCCCTCLIFQSHWWCLSLALQFVSGHCSLLHLGPVDDAFPQIFREWVTAMGYCVSSLLIMSILETPGSECHSFFVFQAFWSLFLTLQFVSACHALLHFKSVDTCYWLNSKWVITVPHWISSYCWYSVIQWVSGWCVLLHFQPADNPCYWLFSVWVAATTHYILRLLTTPLVGSLACECLACPSFNLSPLMTHVLDFSVGE